MRTALVILVFVLTGAWPMVARGQGTITLKSCVQIETSRPVLLRAAHAPHWAVKNLGTALGFEPGLEFERTELDLRDGDSLVLYSDGVSEAFNPQEECYGNERLLADAGSLSDQAAPAITAGLLHRVRAFAGEAPQSDDIAILSLKVETVKAEVQKASEMKAAP